MENLSIPVVPGLFIASLFAGALSSVSSSLSALAATTWEDFFKPYWCLNATEAKATWINRLFIVCYGVSAVLMGLISTRFGGTVLQASLAFTGSFGAPLLGLFSMGVLFPFVNKYGALVGSVCGLIISGWLSIGSYLNGKQLVGLPTNISNCDVGTPAPPCCRPQLGLRKLLLCGYREEVDEAFINPYFVRFYKFLSRSCNINLMRATPSNAVQPVDDAEAIEVSELSKQSNSPSRQGDDEPKPVDQSEDEVQPGEATDEPKPVDQSEDEVQPGENNDEPKPVDQSEDECSQENRRRSNKIHALEWVSGFRGTLNFSSSQLNWAVQRDDLSEYKLTTVGGWRCGAAWRVRDCARPQHQAIKFRSASAVHLLVDLYSCSFGTRADAESCRNAMKLDSACCYCTRVDGSVDFYRTGQNYLTEFGQGEEQKTTGWVWRRSTSFTRAGDRREPRHEASDSWSDSEVHCYTDGSMRHGLSGFGACVFFKEKWCGATPSTLGSTPVFFRARCLPSAPARQRGCAEGQLSGRKFIFHSDSQAVLRALCRSTASSSVRPGLQHPAQRACARQPGGAQMDPGPRRLPRQRERADLLAKAGSAGALLKPGPGAPIPASVINSRVKRWTDSSISAGPSTEERCPFCRSGSENAEHFICHCPVFTRARLTHLGPNPVLSDVLQAPRASRCLARYLSGHGRADFFPTAGEEDRAADETDGSP
uniref:Sodium-dependent multivitamin transporter n=1 Tax=Macrostomum lignano TaxID=282301 RepID=A0A1I8FK03_9PLAT